MERLNHLHKVLFWLEKLGFSIQLKKCTFAAKGLTFLGHKLGNSKHIPDDKKFLVIKKLKEIYHKKAVSI